MEERCRVLGETPEKAFYGMRHVWLAAGKGAVEVLMISDALFRYMHPPHLFSLPLNENQILRYTDEEKMHIVS